MASILVVETAMPTIGCSQRNDTSRLFATDCDFGAELTTAAGESTNHTAHNTTASSSALLLWHRLSTFSTNFGDQSAQAEAFKLPGGKTGHLCAAKTLLL